MGRHIERSAPQAHLLRHVKPGDVIYDVGAGFGYFSCAAAKMGATVFALEPNRVVRDLMCEAVRINGLGPVHVQGVAVGSVRGKAWLLHTHERRGHENAAIVADATPDTEQVDVTTIDDFAATHPAPQIVKVDVEGLEAEVLKGARKTFASHAPILIAEIHDAANLDRVTRWLSEMGYRITTDGDRFPIHAVATPRTSS